MNAEIKTSATRRDWIILIFKFLFSQLRLIEYREKTKFQNLRQRELNKKTKTYYLIKQDFEN